MEKSKIAAALLALFLGALGVHKFYLGKTKAGVIHLLLTVGGGILLVIGCGAALAGAMSGGGGGAAFGMILAVIGFLAYIVNGPICLAEFIIYLTKSDEDFHRIYVVGDKSWF